MTLTDWRLKYIGKGRSFILISIIIGMLAALGGVILKQGVALIQNLIHYIIAYYSSPYLFVIFPAVGVFLTTIYVQVFQKGNLGRGVTNILYCISRKSGYVEKDKLYSQMVSSILTVGFGGSAGLEAPIAATGSAVGSNLAVWLGFEDVKERTLLLACGAAAGISAIFNAPIAGVLFALEILLVDMPLPAVVPLLISSASAALISKLIYSGQPFVLITESWQPEHILFYVIFGLIAALFSVYAIRTYFYIDFLFAGRRSPYLKSIVGGTLLGGLIFCFPALYGEGYESVQKLLHSDAVSLLDNNPFFSSTSAWLVTLFAVVLMLLKVIATSVTVGAGGNGGMFGSSLFMGAMCGFFFSHAINLLGLGNLNEVNFTVIGMASFMAGIIHCPLTAIFLIAEITGGYALFVPLMIVTGLTYMITKYFEPWSVYTKKLALKGELQGIDKDKIILNRMQLKNYVEKDFIPLNENDTLQKLVDAITVSKKNVFPVVSGENKLLGIIQLDDVRDIIFADELYDEKYIRDLMRQPVSILDINDHMLDVMKKFEQSESQYLPVTEKNLYAGFISKSKLFTQYRDRLIKESEIPT